VHRRAASAAAVLALLLLGCGDDDREDVLAVMEDARAALVDGDAETACGLLTPHARERTLEYQVDFLPEGTPVPTERHGVPQTCEEIFVAVRKLDPSSVEDAAAARFSVESIDGDRASVRLDAGGGATVDFALAKTGDGWRIDDSEAVPSGY
jgi:hypothetical protein